MIKKLTAKISIQKVLLIGVLVFGIFLNIPAHRVLADQSVDCGSPDLVYKPETHLCVKNPGTGQGINDSVSINDLIVRVINVLLMIAAIIAVLYVVIGGYRYIMSMGNDKAATDARKTITNALIGLALIILSYTLVNIINHAVSTCGSGLSGFGIIFGC